MFFSRDSLYEMNAISQEYSSWGLSALLDETMSQNQGVADGLHSEISEPLILTN